MSRCDAERASDGPGLLPRRLWAMVGARPVGTRGVYLAAAAARTLRRRRLFRRRPTRSNLVCGTQHAVRRQPLHVGYEDQSARRAKGDAVEPSRRSAPGALRRHAPRSRRTGGARPLLRSARYAASPAARRGSANRASGGGGRDWRLRPAPAVPPLGHRSARILFGGRLGAAEEQLLRAILHPLWDVGLVVGHQVREIDEFARLEVDNPEFLMALVDARLVAGDLGLFSRFESAFHRAGTHAHVVGALNTLIDDRYALFNSTLYQLEPDVKEAPGALRDLTAMRWIAALTDPTLLRRGPEDHAPDRRSRRLSAARPVDPARREQAQPQHAQPSAAGEGGGDPRLSGHAPAAACRAPDERLLPPRADRHARAGVDAQDGADAGRAQSGTNRRRHPLHRHSPGRSPAGDVAGGISSGDRRQVPGVRLGAGVHPSARRAVPRGRLLSDAGTPGGAAALSQARSRPVRAAVGDARLRSPRAHVSAVSGDHVPRRARFLP